jgi:hypothetical protein
MAVKYADYEQQGEFFGDLKCSITIENYTRYKEKYGEDRAMGYLQAIQDFTNEFCIMQNIVENKRHIKPAGYYVGPTVSEKALNDFRIHNKEFLNKFDKVEKKGTDNGTSIVPTL